MSGIDSQILSIRVFMKKKGSRLKEILQLKVSGSDKVDVHGQ